MKNISIIIIIIALFAFVSCSQHNQNIKKNDKQFICIKNNYKTLEIKIGTIIKSKESNTSFSFGNLIKSDGELIRFDDRYLDKKLINHKFFLQEQDYCKLYHFAKKIVLESPVLNEVGDTLNFFEFVNEPTNTFQRNLWHPRFKTKGSLITRNYIDSINLIIQKYLEIKND